MHNETYIIHPLIKDDEVSIYVNCWWLMFKKSPDIESVLYKSIYEASELTIKKSLNKLNEYLKLCCINLWQVQKLKYQPTFIKI